MWESNRRGLTSAPAIGELVAELVTGYLNLPRRKSILEKKTRASVNRKSFQEKLIRADPGKSAYGNVICRCETVTEGKLESHSS